MTDKKSNGSSRETVRITDEYLGLLTDADDVSLPSYISTGSLEFPPYWWVVPLETGPDNARDPFARYFVPSPLLRIEEYFRHGEVVDAIRNMSRQHLVKRFPSLCRTNGSFRNVYFVGPPETIEMCIDRFRLWFTSGHASAVPIHFEELFNRDRAEMDVQPYLRIKAWLSVGDEVAWALSEDEADRLLCAFRA